MRIMIDTNVLISYAVFKSETISRFLETAASEPHTLLIPSYVVDEAQRVVARKAPGKYEALRLHLMLLDFEEVITPDQVDVPLWIRDENDLPILRSAIAGAAEALVTGDKDFADAEAGNVEILTPSEFLRRYGA